MDSMRSLNTSLPRTSPPKQQAPNPPEQLLQAFKDAALSVTKLYKTAATDQTKLRAEGYQDALDDLLIYLDKEDIGLSDGEGWKVRQWATARLDGREPITESDDEMEKDRASSPVLQRKPSVTSMPTRNSSPVRPESAAPIREVPEPILEEPTPIHSLPVLPPSSTFSFRSAHPYPLDSEMADDNQAVVDATLVSAATASPSITISRSSRGGSRQANRANRHGTRSTTGSRNGSGGGAGQKRKINFGDFFDIGDLSKDGFGGGGKRSRFA